MSVLLSLKIIFNVVFIFTICVLSAYFMFSLIPTNLQLSHSYVLDAHIHSSTVSSFLMVVDQSSKVCETKTNSGISCIQQLLE